MPDVALVTGAYGTLGQSIVDAFRARGDEVVRVGRKADADGEAVDMSVAEEVEQLWERLERRGLRPRWVVNAAGGYRSGTVAESDPADLRDMHDLNLGTAWWSSREAARRLPAGGAILNVASRSAVSGGAGAAAYAVAKAGVARLTEVLADELAAAGIRVNAILPSVIDTPENRASLSAERMRLAVQPRDVAAVASFLCSDDAAAVTGALVPVYGWA